ncbi:MAG: NUDIX domain-containing protein [Candidatus Sungiibacteriota bacterium]
MNQIANQEWTAEETETLIRLLEKVKADNGWWPDEACMRAAHGAMSAWAPELVITQFDGIARKILLVCYEGGVVEFLGMWHIPGGYGTIADKSIEGACSRIAMRELGIDVDFIRTYEQPYLWRPGEHPYGRPLTLYTDVRPRGTIQETASRRFFGRDELPENIVEPHRRFIKQFI